jgi:16S rRNA (guanine527-N7)-methyltransferase
MENWINLADRHLGITLSDQQYWQFQVLQEELLKWNKKINLTAIRDKKGIQEKHFFDSLTCFMGFEEWPESLIDVGSGAGFPGLPVKIIIPELRLTLVESVDKKADFCRHIVETLGLSDVTVLSKRVEEVAHMPQHREAYDIAIARAVAPAPTLAEYLLPLVKVGGRALMQKGTRGPMEILEAGKIVDLCGGEISDLLRLNFDGIEGEGNLVIIDKLRPTPNEFPRAVGIPAKKPILTSEDEKYRKLFDDLLNG